MVNLIVEIKCRDLEHAERMINHLKYRFPGLAIMDYKITDDIGLIVLMCIEE